MDSPQPLHPNLARLAATYDSIGERLRRREISNVQARVEILALIARDDNGTQWRLDPSDGAWQYQTRSGRWESGEPAAYGFATPTPFDISRPGTAFNPDSKVTYQAVDETLLTPPGSLSGSTRRQTNADGAGRNQPSPQLIRKIVVATAAAALVVGAWLASGGSDDGAKSDRGLGQHVTQHL